jgi:uncharacterized membrane protein YedE/YeeE
MEEKKYWNPIFSGFLLGTVLFIAYAIAGQGIGASGAFARATAQLSYLVDPSFATNAYAGKYLKHGNALSNWIVVELIGTMIGGYISAALSGRIKNAVDRGIDYPVSKRLFWAFLGGVLVAFATRLSRGCTSGQALSGAGGFSVGAWIFMLSAFGAGMLLAPFFRKQWKGLK